MPWRLRAMGRVVMPKPSRVKRRVWSHRTHDSTGALPYRAAGPAARGDARALQCREVGLEPWDMWRHQSPSLPGGGPGGTWRRQSPPASGAGLEPRDTWRHRSPSMSGGVPNATGHMAVLELSSTGSGSGAAGTHGDTRAISCRVRSPTLWD
jgi:hypothetical protein